MPGVKAAWSRDRQMPIQRQDSRSQFWSGARRAVAWCLVKYDAQRARRPWRWRLGQGSFPHASGLVAVAAVLLAMLVGLAVRVHSMVGPLRVDRWVSRHLAERLPVRGLQIGRSGY